MRAFITGSHEYGKPKSDSDVDLVIFVNHVTKERLIELSDTGKMPCKFGKLNLIFATTEEEYGAWLLGKNLCYVRKPLTKEQAIVQHDSARLIFDIEYDHDSGEKE